MTSYHRTYLFKSLKKNIQSHYYILNTEHATKKIGQC